MSLAQAIKTEIEGTTENYRAEALLAELFKNTYLNFDDFMIAFESTFHRAYSNDILKVSTLETATKKKLLKLAVSRNGIYDRLPEGLFHKDIPLEENTTYSQIKQQQKEEESSARSLFAPIENELFFQRIRLEQQKASILEDFDNLDDDFLINLWRIDTSIPRKYALKFIKLLPHAHKIVGNLGFTFKCLELVLDTKVKYTKRFKKQMLGNEVKKEHRLGLDFTLHQDEITIGQPVLEVQLIPENKLDIKNYIGKKSLKQIAEVFLSYFIPMDYEIEIKITYSGNDTFILDKTVGSFLGVDTICKE